MRDVLIRSRRGGWFAASAAVRDDADPSPALGQEVVPEPDSGELHLFDLDALHAVQATRRAEACLALWLSDRL